MNRRLNTNNRAYFTILIASSFYSARGVKRLHKSGNHAGHTLVRLWRPSAFSAQFSPLQWESESRCDLLRNKARNLNTASYNVWWGAWMVKLTITQSDIDNAGTAVRRSMLISVYNEPCTLFPFVRAYSSDGGDSMPLRTGLAAICIQCSFLSC